MKRAVFAVVFASISALSASPVGNTSFPSILEEGFLIPPDSWVDVRAGYEGDFVGDGRMQQRVAGMSRVDSYRQQANSATTTLNICDRVDLYGVFGSSNAQASWRFVDVAGAVHRAVLETFYNFLWGTGGRAILYKWRRTAVGAGGRYEFANYDPSSLTLDAVNVSTGGTHLRWREWQINLDVSYETGLLTPYLGAKYSSARASLGTFQAAISSNGQGTLQMKNRSAIGMYIGCTLSTDQYVMLNVEGRLIDEEAVTVSGDVRF